MKVSTEKIPESQILMTVEIEQDRLEKAREKALRRLSPKAKVPGFRPGKAPASMVRRYFGEERILDEAIDDLAPLAYREAIDADESIDPIARPVFELKTLEPLVFTYRIPIRPTVDLGDYLGIRVDAEPVVVDESKVDDTLMLLRRRIATLEPVEREIRWRDIIRMDVSGMVDGETLIEQQEAEVQLMEDRDVLFPGFEEELLGHAKGDEFEFDLATPESLSDAKFAGKQCHFTVKIVETKEEILPELDEDFVKLVGEGYESVEALTTKIRDDLVKAATEERDNKLHDQILNEMVERATIEFPPVMLENEVDRMLHEQAGHIERGEDMEKYLAAIGKTADQMRQELQPIAEGRLRRSLVLGKLAEAENIAVSDDDVTAEIERLAGAAGAQSDQLRQLFGSEDGRSTVRRRLMTDRTLARMIEFAAVETGKSAKEAKPAKGKKTKTKVAKGAAADATVAAEATATGPAPQGEPGASP